jgi:hypothetical protein
MMMVRRFFEAPRAQVSPQILYYCLRDTCASRISARCEQLSSAEPLLDEPDVL